MSQFFLGGSIGEHKKLSKTVVMFLLYVLMFKFRVNHFYPCFHKSAFSTAYAKKKGTIRESHLGPKYFNEHSFVCIS
jgi:hypothetical protein